MALGQRARARILEHYTLAHTLAAYAALMLILPGPGTNGPPAFGTIIMSLGVLENDSKVVGIGILVTILANIFATGVLVAIAWFGIEALSYLI